MRIIIEYESDKLLPQEISDQFDACLKKIIATRYETDKTVCNMMNLKGTITHWLHSVAIEIEGGKNESLDN